MRYITFILFLFTGILNTQNILLYTETTGYDHNTREEAEMLLSSLATEHDWTFTVDNTGIELDNLSDYDLIWFSNTSGDNFTSTERGFIETFASNGGDFISEHASSDSYGHSTCTNVLGNGFGIWDWWAENVTGCSVQNSPNHTSNNYSTTIDVTNANTILDGSLNFSRIEDDEWYYWEKGYIDTDFIESHRISSTGINSYDEARMSSHYWIRPDGGKSWYSSQGHNQSSYTSETDFQQSIENGLRWALSSTSLSISTDVLSQIKVFPVPFVNKDTSLNVSGLSAGTFNLSIYTLFGQTMSSEIIQVINGTHSIPIDIMLSNGTYLLKLENRESGEKKYNRFIIQR